jgi:hypothetical protein
MSFYVVDQFVEFFASYQREYIGKRMELVLLEGWFSLAGSQNSGRLI